jgi:hypothetical protein
MPFVYWFSPNKIDTYAEMLDSGAIVTNLDDNAPGDTLTGNTFSDLLVIDPGSCGILSRITAWGTVIVDLGDYGSLSAWQATHQHDAGDSFMTPCPSASIPGPAGPGALLAVDYSLDGNNWTPLTVPPFTFLGAPISITSVGSLSPVYARFLRLQANSSYEVEYDDGRINAAGGFTDVRATFAPSAPGLAPTVTLTTDCSGGASAAFTTVPGASAHESRWRRNGGAWTAWTTASSPIALSGYTPGDVLTVEVRGTNSLGSGPSGSASAIINAGCAEPEECVCPEPVQSDVVRVDVTVAVRGACAASRSVVGPVAVTVAVRGACAATRAASPDTEALRRVCSDPDQGVVINDIQVEINGDEVVER